MLKRLKAGVAAAALTITPLAVIAVAEPAHAAKSYRNCTHLTKTFDHGVSRSKRAAMKQVRQGYGKPAYGKRARAVYWENRSSMDRDKDGTACER